MRRLSAGNRSRVTDVATIHAERFSVRREVGVEPYRQRHASSEMLFNMHLNCVFEYLFAFNLTNVHSHEVWPRLKVAEIDLCTPVRIECRRPVPVTLAGPWIAMLGNLQTCVVLRIGHRPKDGATDMPTPTHRASNLSPPREDVATLQPRRLPAQQCPAFIEFEAHLTPLAFLPH